MYGQSRTEEQEKVKRNKKEEEEEKERYSDDEGVEGVGRELDVVPIVLTHKARNGDILIHKIAMRNRYKYQGDNKEWQREIEK